MNRRDDGIKLEDNDDEEELEEKPPSEQETLQVLRTLRSVQCVLNLPMSFIHMNGLSNECLITEKTELKSKVSLLISNIEKEDTFRARTELTKGGLSSLKGNG
ncbi:hypothetical protein AVEN_81834-1 [Araneus ventricosus]|uniref:Uncharacterized protein n=1 Tax=Araneus ventricosus TaxID=182803 RepID=A0A4Y2I4A7_ARAVE|nr:hypothetical protein AVEN_81834-1 [Araneus ventricosus]